MDNDIILINCNNTIRSSLYYIPYNNFYIIINKLKTGQEQQRRRLKFRAASPQTRTRHDNNEFL